MKALTIHPLYAMCITFGEKTIENRSWKTSYRGDILITSSAKKIECTVPGHALCIAELYDVRKFTKDDLYAACMEGETEFDEYAWSLRNIRIIKPVPVKGKLSLWECDIKPEIILPPEPLNQPSQKNADWINLIYDSIAV